MHLAIFLDSFEITGGGRTNVLQISKRLVKNYDYKIDIFTRKIGNDNSLVVEQYNNLRIFYCGPKTTFFNPFGRFLSLFTLVFSFLKEHKKNPYDLINAHVYLGALSGKAASLITKTPIVLTVHGTNLTDLGIHNLAGWLEKQICFQWQYNAVIAVGAGYKKYPNINKNIFIIPNGVDIQNVSQNAILCKTVKKKFFQLLFVGRLQKLKGMDVLLSAINLLREQNITLTIVGYGYEERRYRKMIQGLSLSSKVFFKGKLNEQELIHEYSTHDLLVVPSLSEGDGIVIKEAWANRLPVLATKCNGPEYFINNNIDGFLVEKNSSLALAEKIKTILKLNPEQLRQMGENGYQKVKEKYQWNTIVKKTAEVYKNIVSNK